MLAANFPGGSARGEIKRRVMMLAEKGEVRSAAVSQVIEEIVKELIDAWRYVSIKIPTRQGRLNMADKTKNPQENAEDAEFDPAVPPQGARNTDTGW